MDGVACDVNARVIWKGFKTVVVNAKRFDKKLFVDKIALLADPEENLCSLVNGLVE